MRIVHSLWTKPMIVERRGEGFERWINTTVVTYATSFAYAKKQGFEVVLYADGLGRDLLNFIPYDEVYDLRIPDVVPVYFWAIGKFFTLYNMNLGDIHIDGDVFLIGDKLKPIIESDYDMIVLNIESDDDVLTTHYTNARHILRDYNIPLPEGLTHEKTPAYNCGVVGFKNEELKTKYLENYFGIFDGIMSNEEAFKAVKENKKCCMDLVMELQFLYQLAENKYNVCNMLGSGKDALKKADELDFVHLVGIYKDQYINNVLLMLKNANEELYAKCIIKINSFV